VRFLIDECVGPTVSRRLREEGHDVFSVYEQGRGMEDDAVFLKALDERRILITNDKDFGEIVFRERRPHRGIVLPRLDDERGAVQVDVLERLLARYADRLADHFVVVTETRVRFAGRPK
jgi:predicted nuclease of predicted toxin-antitoxin system